MVLFSLYIIVSSTLLVQSFHNSARWSGGSRVIENPVRIYRSNALPQSKVENKLEDLNQESLQEIKNVVTKLLEKIDHPVKSEKRRSRNLHFNKRKLLPVLLHKNKKREKNKKCADNVNNIHKRIMWDKWNEWSPCSVTCGKGREIRWRNCLGNCDGVETEMEEKPCQLPACGGKLFGLIKL